MQLHKEFIMMFNDPPSSNFINFLYRYIPFLPKERPFSYLFKDTILSIDELKHGILRGLRVGETFYGFAKNDPKKSFSCIQH